MQKFLDFIKKYKFVLMLASSTLFMFFSGYVWWLWIVGVIINFAFYAICTVSEMLCATMYYELFSGIGVFFITSILELLLIMVIRYIIDVVKKRKKLYILPLILTFAIIIIFSSIHYSVDLEGFFQGAIVIAFLLSSYIVFVYWKEINISECFKYLIIGMAVSLVLSMLSLVLPGYRYDGLINLSGGVIWSSRLNLFTLNPNHLAMYCTLAIAYFVTRVANGKGNEWINAFYILFSVVIGIFTLSKAFLIVCVLLMIYLFVFIIIRYKRKSFYLIIPAMIFAVIFCCIFNKQVAEIFNRFFFFYGDGMSILENIFTGRIGIWEDYINSIRSSVLKLLFGFGFFNTKVFINGPHNLYIFLLYRFGLVGIIMLGLLVWSYFKCSQTKFRPNLKNFVLLFIYLLLGFEELVLNDRFLFFFLFAVILIAQSVDNDLYLADTNFDKFANRVVTKIKDKFKSNQLATKIIDNITIKSQTESNSENANKQNETNKTDSKITETNKDDVK